MNKIISTHERIFMCITGASGTGKTQLILSMLTLDPDSSARTYTTFQPEFEHIIYFYKYWQPVYDTFIQRLTLSKIEFVQGTSSEVINNVMLNESSSSTTTRKLLIFDDSCEEILQSAEFVNLATAGRHMGIHVIFIKHNLFQQGKYSVTVDKNTTHIVVTRSPRIGKQLNILGREIDGASSTFLIQCYKKATSNKYGHLLIDLSPACNDFLRFCSGITGTVHASIFSGLTVSEPATFWLSQAMIDELPHFLENDEETRGLYAEALSNV